jgi:hypothetical protein
VAAEMTDADLFKIRQEVGSAPDDSVVEDTWESAGGGVTETALAILRPRLADALAAAGRGSVTLPGALSVGAPAQPTQLATQISRLEGQLAAQSGTPDVSGLAASSVLAGRRDRPR